MVALQLLVTPIPEDPVPLSSSEFVDTKHTYSTHIHACMQNIHKSFFNKIYFNCPTYFIFLWPESLSHYILYSYGQKVCLLGHQNRHLINLFAFFPCFICACSGQRSASMSFSFFPPCFYEAVSH